MLAIVLVHISQISEFVIDIFIYFIIFLKIYIYVQLTVLFSRCISLLVVDDSGTGTEGICVYFWFIFSVYILGLYFLCLF